MPSTRSRVVQPPVLDAARSQAAVRELWLALHLPRFMLEALTQADSQFAEASHLAVVDLENGAKVVCDCTPALIAAGVRSGMAINSALALAPSLQMLARDTRRERALIEAVAALALERFTPRVSIEPPDAVLLEVRGSLSLLGGARNLLRSVHAELQVMGITAQLALTPTPLASLWFARAGQEVALRHVEQLRSRLSALPLTTTARWEPRSIELLATMGARTIGDCLRLPRDGFARRFEPRMLEMLDLAIGRRPDARRAFRARERFAARRDFEPEISDVERLERALQPMLDELGEYLRQRGRGLQTLDLQLEHRELPRTRLRLRFMQPAAQVSRMMLLLHERLAALALPAPVRAARLRSGPLLEIAETPQDLFARDTHGSSAVASQLIERLRARLGVDAVYGLCLVPEHRPESAWRIAELDVAPKGTGSRTTTQPGAVATMVESPRPLWLLPEPQSLGNDETPRCEGALDIESGPERIETGWWDGKGVARDYYVACNSAGVRLWIYRERRSHSRARGWFLHGVFG